MLLACCAQLASWLSSQAVFNLIIAGAYNFLVSFTAVMVGTHVPMVLLYTWGASHLVAGLYIGFRKRAPNDSVIVFSTISFSLGLSLLVATLYETVKFGGDAMAQWFANTFAIAEVLVGFVGWYLWRLQYKVAERIVRDLDAWPLMKQKGL